MNTPTPATARTRRALHLAEGALVATLLAGMVAFLTTTATALASAMLGVSLLMLADGPWPDPAPRRLRLAAITTTVQTTLLVVAIPANLLLDPDSLLGRALSTMAGLVLLGAIHLVTDGFVRAFDSGDHADELVEVRWSKVWRSLRMLDVFLAVGVVLALVAAAVSSQFADDDGVSFNVSISFAPAAMVGLGTLYRLGRADQALRRWLATVDGTVPS